MFDGLMEHLLKKKEQAETSKYHNDTIAMKQKQFEQNSALQPLKMELLKAQIMKARQAGTPGISKEQQKANIKKAGEIEETAKIITKYANNAAELSNLLEKHPEVGGYLTGVRNKHGLPMGENEGTFNANAGPLQAQMAKDLSQRGGAVAAGIAGGMKPNIGQRSEYNKAMLKTMHNKNLRGFNELNEEYKMLTGRDLPTKLPKFYETYKPDEEENANVEDQGSSANVMQPEPSTDTSAPQPNANGDVILYKDGEEYTLPANLMQRALKEGFKLER